MMKKTDEAIIEFQEAIRLNSEYALAHHNLGEAYLNKKKYESAERSFLEALRISPDYEELRYDLAETKIGWGFELLWKEDIEGAATHFKESMKWAEYASAYEGVCWVRLRQGDLTEALTAGEEAIKIDSKYSGGHACMGAIAFEESDTELAVEHWRSAVNLNPANGHLWMGLALAWYASDNAKEAADAYCKASTHHTHYGDKNALLSEPSISWSENSIKTAALVAEAGCPQP